MAPPAVGPVCRLPTATHRYQSAQFSATGVLGTVWQTSTVLVCCIARRNVAWFPLVQAHHRYSAVTVLRTVTLSTVAALFLLVALDSQKRPLFCSLFGQPGLATVAANVLLELFGLHPYPRFGTLAQGRSKINSFLHCICMQHRKHASWEVGYDRQLTHTYTPPHTI